jgi:thiamine biosynthesis protein ThiI
MASDESITTPRSGGAERIWIIRYAAELSIKSKRTQDGFRRRLIRNIRDALRSSGGEFSIDGRWGRILVRTSSDQAPAALSRVFGLSSISEVDAVVPAELDAIVRAGEALYADRVRGRTYAVRAKRSGRHPFRSRDVMVQLGAALNREATVDLDNPEVTVNVDIRDDEAWLFTDHQQGVGGLPLGVEGHAVALLSGGYDSPVAAWLMLKRGVTLDYVFCNLGGDAYERAVVQVAKILADGWSYGYRPRLHVVDFQGPLDALRERVTPRYWQVVLKRLMYRTASAIGAELEAQAIVTGEAIGQVSSQTLTNLRAIEPAASLPVFRPLLGFDKTEIIARAERIGTAALSARVKEYCAIAPGKPVTAAKEEAVAAEESKLDLSVLDAAIASRRVLDLRALKPVDLVAPYIFTTEIPAGAAVIDCRPEEQYRLWHWPGAERRDDWELARDLRRLDRDRTYVLYCAQGVQTAYLAELMQREGYEAYSFKGGVRGLRRYAEEKAGARAGNA